MRSIEDINARLIGRIKFVLRYGILVGHYCNNDFSHYLFSKGREFFEIVSNDITGEIVWVMPCIDHDLDKYLDHVGLSQCEK